MGRVLVLIALIIALLGSDVAIAGEASSTRLPISTNSQSHPQTSVVVVPGDHLWKISARHLQGKDKPVAPYWLDVIEVNKPGLRSGNPDLIYPGEIIELP